MNDALAKELIACINKISPWVTMDEMAERYGCTKQTVTAMERRGEIPTRVHGRWLRSQLVEWEQSPNFPQNRRKAA